MTIHPSLDSSVSIVVLSYNQRGFIVEAIESVLGQDYRNIEIVLADDGSTDGTAEIISEYAEKFPNRIKACVGGPNLGVTGNCNRGLSVATGDYIGFLGGDDVLLPGKLSAQMEWLAANPRKVLCGHEVDVFYEDESRPPHHYFKALVAGSGPGFFIRQGLPFCGISIVVRRSAIPAHGFEQSLRTVSDFMFWIECVIPNREWGFIEGIFARYRRHSSNVSNDDTVIKRELLQSLDLIQSRYPKFHADCNVGRARLYEYAMGMKHLLSGEAKRARPFFLRSALLEPRRLKVWIRYLQSILLSLLPAQPKR